jgi:hypothetical protein
VRWLSNGMRWLSRSSPSRRGKSELHQLVDELDEDAQAELLDYA